MIIAMIAAISMKSTVDVHSSAPAVFCRAPHFRHTFGGPCQSSTRLERPNPLCRRHDTWYQGYQGRKISIDETSNMMKNMAPALQRYRYSFTNDGVNAKCSPPMPCVRVPCLPPLDEYRANLLHKGRWVSLKDVKCDFQDEMITWDGWPNFNNSISMVRACCSAVRMSVVW